MLFRLRAVDESDLVAGIDTGLGKARKASPDKVLNAADVSALFGLDMADAAAAPAPKAKKTVAKPAPAKPPVARPMVVVKPLASNSAPTKREPVKSRATQHLPATAPAKRSPVKPVVPAAAAVGSVKPPRLSKPASLPQKPLPRPAAKVRGTR